MLQCGDEAGRRGFVACVCVCAEESNAANPTRFWRFLNGKRNNAKASCLAPENIRESTELVQQFWNLLLSVSIFFFSFCFDVVILFSIEFSTPWKSHVRASASAVRRETMGEQSQAIETATIKTTSGQRPSYSWQRTTHIAVSLTVSKTGEGVWEWETDGWGEG